MDKMYNATSWAVMRAHNDKMYNATSWAVMKAHNGRGDQDIYMRVSNG